MLMRYLRTYTRLAGSLALVLVALVTEWGSLPAPWHQVALSVPTNQQSEEAWFMFDNPPRRETFIIKLTDPAKIQKARDILDGRETDARQVSGVIVKEPVYYNPPWSFHLDPQSIEFFEVAVEVCDASIAYTESNLNEAGGAFLPGGSWCPWGSRLLKEVAPPAYDSERMISVSAASYRRVGLASGSIAAAFGSGLATATEAALSLPLPTSLAGTTVRVKDEAGNERLAPLFFVSPTQINYLVPLGTEPGMATVMVTSADGSTAKEWTQILPVAPSVFAVEGGGQGLAAALAFRIKADGSESYEPVTRFDPVQSGFVAVPIDLGPETDQVFLVLFCTGLRNYEALTDIVAQIGGREAEVLYAGEHPDMVGVDQVNLRIPRELIGSGSVDVVLWVDDKRANLVKISIK